jgi:hypothetical protein
MEASARSLPQMLVPILVVIAIAGYLVGIKHPQSAAVTEAAEKTRVAYGASVLLRYPSGWSPTAGVPTIPGLPVSSPLVLAPNGNSANAGLLSGQLPHDGTSPLPESFIAELDGVPHTEVVELVNVQAYRYSSVHVHGYEPTLELYVVPNSSEIPTVLACYASPGFASVLHECEDMVAKLALTGVSSFNVNPEPGYARRLGTLITALDRERAALRQQMSVAGITPGAVGVLARKVAAKFNEVAESLTVLEPPIAAAPSQAALAAALVAARNSYHHLGTIASGQRKALYNEARSHITHVEDVVDRALESFALLGYSSS